MGSPDTCAVCMAAGLSRKHQARLRGVSDNQYLQPCPFTGGRYFFFLLGQFLSAQIVGFCSTLINLCPQ